jgi:PAS domain S-box-containing protein
LLEWVSTGWIQPFSIGQDDVPDRLLVPEKLYGRTAECQKLLDAFERVAATGKPELLLVSGYSGIGKSSVVHELHKAVLSRGIFIFGKFDQHQRDVPYATLAEAFQTLVRQILIKSESEVNYWRRALSVALGPNAQLMVNLVAELELVIGPQPPVPELPPQEAQIRFEVVLRQFVGLFARKQQPLVLFLDDLQWLDPATLKLFEQFVHDPGIQNLLLVGAYRDNEVNGSHPLMLTLETIRRTEATMHEMVLLGLSPEDLNQLIGDALHCERAYTQPLAELVDEKTEGNPFFTIQFLTTLAEERLLAFEAPEAAWRWDEKRIRAIGFTDNVVDLVIAKLRRLPSGTEETLRQLACLGNGADITTLLKIHGGSETDLHRDLWEAVRAGLIQRLDNSYKFLHDRIQEAAYLLIPEPLRAQFHANLGRLLITGMTPEQISERIFDIVNQFNRGRERIADSEEQEHVAELNLLAARKAKASTAYASACAYLSTGMELVGAEAWGRRYPLAFCLWLERAECEYLIGDFETAEGVISTVLDRAESNFDRAAAYRLKILLEIMKSEYRQAVDIGLQTLGLFGIQMPVRPSREEVRAEYEKIWQNLGGRSIESLIDLPLMSDPEQQAAMRVLAELSTPAWYTDSNLFCLQTCKMANLSLQYGITSVSPHGYAELASILGPIFQRFADGYRFGMLACNLADKHGFAGARIRAYLGMARVAPWTKSIATAVDFVRTAFRAGIETHDQSYTCFTWIDLITNLLLQGVHLDEVWRESEKGLEFARKAKFRDAVDFIISQQRFIQNMRGGTKTFSSFSDAAFDEGTFEAQLTEGRMSTMVCYYWIFKLQARFLSYDYDAAVAAAQKVKGLLWSAETNIQSLNYWYYYALTIAATHEAAGQQRQRESLAELKQHRDQLQKWSESSPATFLDKYTLLAAEVARIENQELDAMRWYEQAIRTARENGFVHCEGISNELAARFCLQRGLEKFGYSYLRDARDCYLRWGASGKAKHLERCFPEIAEQESPPSSTAGSAPFAQLDVESVVKASQAVSGEIILEKLVETLMVIAVEHAGAERGLLILSCGGECWIESESRSRHQKVEVDLRRSPVTSLDLPESLLRYVIRTRESVILDDAISQNLFSRDPYLIEQRARSVLCVPLVKQTKLIGALYLENNLAPRVFTPKRLAMLELLASQAAISLDHARLYAELTQENRERRKAEEALRSSEERLQDIIDNTTAVILVKDLELRYLLVNREFEQRHSVHREQIRGKTDFDIHPPEVAEAVRASDRLVIERGKSIQIEEKVRSAQGERVCISVKFLLRDRTGKAYAVCGIATDITESKRAEEIQAALTRERETLAQERATQLARANEALRASLDALATVPELDEFIGQVMAAITRQLGAVSSNLRVLNAEGKVMRVELLFQEGRVMSAADGGYPERLRSMRIEDLGFISLNEPVTVVHLLGPTGGRVPADLRDYLLDSGVRTVLTIPLISSDEVNGILGFRFTEDRDFEAEELEIARALATQASLAIQLTHLAETAKQSAVLEERNRLASEIHDSLAQSFAGISMQLSAASRELKKNSKETLNYVERANELARFGLSEARRSVLSLRSNIIEESGLIGALQRLVERSTIPGLLRCTFRTSRVHEKSLAPQVQQGLLRIAQEGMSNALRHARPTKISITLRLSPPDLVLKITDNGAGFAGNEHAARKGFGITNMRARAESLGAQLDIRSRPGKGTSVVIRLRIEP